jgi:hypothetical protein
MFKVQNQWMSQIDNFNITINLFLKWFDFVSYSFKTVIPKNRSRSNTIVKMI